MPLLLVYSIGGSLDPIDDYRSLYYSLIGAGYLAGFVMLFVSAVKGWKILGVKIPARVQFDLWLGAFLCAFILVGGLIYFRFPNPPEKLGRPRFRRERRRGEFVIPPVAPLRDMAFAAATA